MANPAATRVRAALREQINGEQKLARIEQVVQALLAGEETVTDRATGQQTPVPLTRERVAALKTALDVELRLLSKVLPDLKAVEVTGEDGVPLPASSDRMVLATKLMAIMREGGTLTIEGEAERLPDFLT